MKTERNCDSDIEFEKLIGSRIRKIREAKSLTQNDVAKAVSISQTSITNLENGKGMVSIPILFEILRYLDVGVEVIFREYSHVANRTMVDLSELESLLSEYPEEQRSTMIRSLASFIRAAKLS